LLLLLAFGTPLKPLETLSPFPSTTSTAPPVFTRTPPRIARLLPSGGEPLDEVRSVSVRFDQPMAMEGQPLRIKPEPPGQYRWLDPQTFVFEPSAKRFPKATEFIASVPAGLVSAGGTTLEAGTEWRFSTARPRLVVSTPRDGAAGFDPGALLSLEFSAPVDAQELAKTAQLLVDGRTIALQVGRVVENSIELRPAEKLPLNTACELRVPATLRSPEGPLPMGEAAHVKFKTAGPLVVEHLKCGGELLGDRCNSEVTVVFNNPLVAQKLAALVHVEPAARSIIADSGGLHLRGPWESEIQVHIDAGVRDAYGQPLVKPYAFHFRGPANTLYESLEGPSLFESGSKASLRLHATDRQSGAFRIARLPPEKIDRAIEFLANGGTWTFDRTTPLDLRAAPDTLTDVELPIDGRGIFLVEAELGATKVVERKFLGNVVQVTSIGILAAVDGQEIVAQVGALRDDAPIAGARVSLYDGGRSAASVTTDARGIARLPGRDVLRTLERLVLVAESGDEICLAVFAPVSEYARKDYRFDRVESIAGLWSDRPVYRPGETAHIFGVARTRAPRSRFRPAPASVHWVAEQWAEKRETVAEGDAKPDSAGLIAFDLPVSKSSPLGTISIRTEDWAARTSIRVMEARAPESRVSVRTVDEPRLLGGVAHVDVEALTYFGAPLAHGRVRWTIDAWSGRGNDQPLKGFRAEIVPLPGEAEPQPREEKQIRGEAVLDDQGKLRLPVPLDPDCAPTGDCSFTVEVEALDALARGVAESAGFTAWRGPYTLGLKTEQDEGGPLVVHAVAANQRGEKLDVPIEVRLMRTVVVADPGAGPPVEEVEIARALAPARFELPRSDERFIIRARTTTQPSLRADTETWNASRGAPRLTVKADKKQYLPGETARLTLTGPAAGARGLLTVDANGIVEVRPIEPGTTQLDVPIAPNWLPSARVQVVLVKDGEGASASETLRVSSKLQEMVVTVEPSTREARPGQAIDVAVHAAPGAHVVLSVVDRSALEMLPKRYSVVDPLASIFRAGFYGNNLSLIDVRDDRISLAAHSPSAYHSFSYATEEIVVTGTRVREPDPTASFALRADFQPTAYFDAHLTADPSGLARAHFKLPDQASEFRVLAFAVDELPLPHVGMAEATIRTRLPLLLQPSLPRFVNAGDSFEASALIHNLTDRPQRTRVQASAENLFIDEKPQNVTIPAGKSRLVRFAARASAAGIAQVKIAAQSDAVQVALPVLEPISLETFAAYGVTEGAVQVPLSLPHGVLRDRGGLQISLSSTALSGLHDAGRYIVDYPYECVEQTSSRLIALVALRRAGIDVPNYAERLRAVIRRLQVLQRPNGGFTFWPGGDEDPAGTAWAAFALSQLQNEHDHDVEALLFLAQERLERPHQSWPDEAVALAQLAMREPDKNDLKWLYARRRQLPLFAQAFLLESLTSAADPRAKDLARELLDRAAETAGGLHFEENTAYRFGSPELADAAVLHALLTTGASGTEVDKLARGLLAERHDGRWQNTHSNAWGLLALSRYFEKFEGAAPAFDAGVWLLDRTLTSHRFEGRSAEISRTEVPMAALQDASLVVGKEGRGRLYFRLGLAAARPAIDVAELRRGFSLSREIYDERDQALKAPYRVKAGSLLRVRLMLSTPGPRTDVAVADHLAAGLEPLDPSLATTAKLPRTDHGWWWTYRELREGGARVFADQLGSGTYVYDYYVRATTKGHFAMPAPEVQEMYSPETQGRGLPIDLTVE
jgi:uncharacterized protein YfaS (alpha-2-macroglobulin family)